MEAESVKVKLHSSGDSYLNGGNVGIGCTNPNIATFQSGCSVLSIEGDGADDFGVLELRSPDLTSANRLGEIRFVNKDGGSSYVGMAGIRAIRDGADDATAFGFYTEATGGGISERMHIDSVGNVKVNSGNLVIGTSGKGIDFSATSDATGKTSELLDDYEEGEWTPVVKDASNNACGMGGANGFYTKIGRTVHVTFSCLINSVSGTTSSSGVTVRGLPYTVNNSQYGSAEPSGGLITFMNNLDSVDWGGQVFLRANNGTTYFELKYTPGGAQTGIGITSFTIGQFDAGADSFMCGSCTYII
jgi:hypothetical protein